MVHFNIAKQMLQDQERRINDTKGRLDDFTGFEKKDDDKSLPSCEPMYLYYLDDSTQIPQIMPGMINMLVTDTTMGYYDESGKLSLPPGITKDMFPKGFLQ